MKILIYDTISSNHLFSFLKIILNHLNNNSKYSEVHIILNSKFLNDNLIFFTKFSKNKNIFISSLPLKLDEKIRDSNYNILKSIYEIRFILSYARSNNIFSVLFLYIDYFQVALGFMSFFLRKHKLKIYGILFESYVYRSIKSRKYWTSWIQIKIMEFNKSIIEVFILNDDRIVSKLNYEGQSLNYSLLPDPVYKPSYSKIDFRKLYGLSNSDFIFLSLGRVNPRKNVFRLIEAFKNLDSLILENSKLVICGSFDDLNYKKLLMSSISDRVRNHILVLDVHLDDSTFDTAIYQSNCVCTVYDNFMGSSGIIGKAAMASKIVLSSNSGTIGYIVNKFNLGVVVDPTSVLSISQGISKIYYEVDVLLQNSKATNYCMINSESKFSDQIFNRIN